MASYLDNARVEKELWRGDTPQKWNAQSEARNKGMEVRWRRMNSDGDHLPVSFQRNASHHFNKNNDSDMEEVKEAFNKKYTFKPPELGWGLPLETEMYTAEKWKINEMLEMKDELNTVKNKLNNYNLDAWHKHTRAMNKAGAVAWTLRKEVNPEFVTQAWCKFYEVCWTYNLVCEMAQEECCLNSVHLCEAPGAFIASLNHYLKLNHPDMKWNWISTTLNPYYEENPLSNMINDDRFILHTLDHWKFGHDYTGNLMDLQNLIYMVQQGKELGPILLVTADGSIDCQNEPSEQESIVSQLIFCEVVAALHILSQGGNFLVKMFTMYEQETICLMYLLTCVFQTVNVCKPATSKEGNSEVYVVCLDYVGTESLKPWLRALRTAYCSKPAEKAMFCLSSLPKDFLVQIKECAEKFKNYQVEVIERNIYLFNIDNNQPSIKRTKRLRYLIAEEYIKRYHLRPLPNKEDQIVGDDKLKSTETPNMDPKCEQGSFNDKLEREKMHPLEKLKMMLSDINSRRMRWEYKEDIKWLVFPTRGSKFDIIIGKPVKSVHSSKFCSGRLLNIRNNVRTLTKDHFEYQTPKMVHRKNCQADEMSPEILNIIVEQCPTKEFKVLNYKETLWASLESGENEQFERNAFFDIMEEIEDFWRGGHFVLQGYPMLTQFTAGVIYMLGHLFEKVGFVRPSGQDFAVIFYDYRSLDQKMMSFVRKVDRVMDDLYEVKNTKSVLSVIPLTELIYGHEEFYSCVTAVNNLCVQEQICEVIQQVIKSPFKENSNEERRVPT